MMGNRRSCKASLSPAQLAEGMLGEELTASLPPGGAVALVGAGIPLVAFVGLCSFFRMLLTIPSIGEIRTTRMAARSLGLVRHERISFG
jgi:hypothetical protein